MADSTLQKEPAKPRNPAPTFRSFPMLPATGRRKFARSSTTSARLPTILRAKPLSNCGSTRGMIFYAGRTPRGTPATGSPSRDLCNHFLTAKEQQRDAGDIKARRLANTSPRAKFVVDSFGKNSAGR